MIIMIAQIEVIRYGVVDKEKIVPFEKIQPGFRGDKVARSDSAGLVEESGAQEEESIKGQRDEVGCAQTAEKADKLVVLLLQGQVEEVISNLLL